MGLRVVFKQGLINLDKKKSKGNGYLDDQKLVILCSKMDDGLIISVLVFKAGIFPPKVLDHIDMSLTGCNHNGCDANLILLAKSGSTKNR